jgi:hypothetical protein
VLLSGSHFCGAVHWASEVHSTHWLDAASQTRGAVHLLAPSQLALHVCSTVSQTGVAAGQSASATQATQPFVVGSHTNVGIAAQSAFVAHPTHTPFVTSQCGVVAPHIASVEHFSTAPTSVAASSGEVSTVEVSPCGPSGGGVSVAEVSPPEESPPASAVVLLSGFEGSTGLVLPLQAARARRRKTADWVFDFRMDTAHPLTAGRSRKTNGDDRRGLARVAPGEVGAVVVERDHDVAAEPSGVGFENAVAGNLRKAIDTNR